MVKGDIFRWKWNKAELEKRESKHEAGTLYWCMSQIAIFDGQQLVDTYWGGSSSTTRFTEEKALSQLNLTFVANKDDLTPCNEDQKLYYKLERIVDLNHPNCSSGNVFLRKGSCRDKNHMRKVIEEERQLAQGDIDNAKRRRNRYTSMLVDLENVHADEIFIK